MAIYFNVAEVWKLATRPFLKVGGVWKPVDVYRKTAGTWAEAYQYDVQASNPPQISLVIVETFEKDKLVRRYVRVGVRTPGVGHDQDLKRIRVLTTYNEKMPTTQFGGTYTARSDEDFDKEPWSDWEYNGYGGHTSQHLDSSVNQTKPWPLNPSNTTIIPAGDVHIAAWSEDLNGNWSAGNFAQITIPKVSVDAPHIVTKEARFQPNASGSFRGGDLVYGKLIQDGNPLSRGMWFHGNQMSDSIGTQGDVTVKGAQIFVQRAADNGQATANVYLFRHLYPSAADVPADPNWLGVVKLGTINSEESKWFPIPEDMWPFLKTTKGFGLYHKDPAKATTMASDYTVMKQTEDAPRCGEVHVTWTEKLG